MSMLVYTPLVSAQTYIEQEKFIPQVHVDSVYVLHEWVVKNSIRVTLADTLLTDEYWRFNYSTGTWRIRPENMPEIRARADVRIQYLILPVRLRRVYASREIAQLMLPDSLRADTLGLQRTVRIRQTSTDDLFGNANIEKSGSLTRGFTVGSNRDLALESGLRLDMRGNITDDVELIATLTDQSTPIQPDGSTQNLREFDQVYIRMQSKQAHLQLGDIDVSFQNSEFARITRRLQGLEAGGSVSQHSLSAGVAVARGRFKTMQFNGRDGVRGPYRLTGAQGEPFIIVLAGTERVYLDGVRMERGEENDYIIDYGLGEIFFTNKRTIIDQHRITIDFQYINQDFNRTLTAAEGAANDLLDGTLSIGAVFLREADDINVNNQISLSDAEVDVLRQAGDDPTKAVISGVEQVTRLRETDFVLYERRDTLIQGISQKYYIHKPGNESAQFRIRFSRQISGGNYRRSGQTVNGVVYEFVGNGQGDYDTLRTLARPIDHKMVSIRSNYTPSEHVRVFGEWAGSDYNQNRFSELDNQNNFDNAYLIGTQLSTRKTEWGQVDVNARQRYSGRNFYFFDRTRDIEFNRKWNIISDIQSEERFTETDASWSLSAHSNLKVGLGWIERDDIQGNRQDISVLSAEESGPVVNYFAERIESSDKILNQDGEWFRQLGSIAYPIKTSLGTFTPEIGYEHENRNQNDVVLQTVSPLSWKFYDVRPGVVYQMSEKLSLSAHYSYRKDERVTQGALRPESEAVSQRYRFNYVPSNVWSTDNEVSFRKRAFSEEFKANESRLDNDAVFIRSLTNFKPYNRALEGQLFYETSTESRALLQETFIEVGPELGQYVWIDVNNDGIQQIDEFFLEQTPNEGTFIKQFIPSDELFPIISLNTRLRAKFTPSRLVSRAERNTTKGKWLNAFEWQGFIDVRENNTTDRLSDIYLLRLHRFQNDSLTLQGRLYWQQEVLLFPNNPDYDVKIFTDRAQGQNRLAIGLEKQQSFNHKAEIRYRIKRRYVVANRFNYSKTANRTENLGNRNFQIYTIEYNPELSVQLSRSLQTALGVSFIEKEDVYPDTPTKVNMLKVSSDARVFFANGFQAFMRAEFRNTTVEGASTSLGNFELTEGAGAGKNWLWSVQANYRFSALMRGSLNYDARTIQDRPTIHTVRFVLSAVF